MFRKLSAFDFLSLKISTNILLLFFAFLFLTILYYFCGFVNFLISFSVSPVISIISFIFMLSIFMFNNASKKTIKNISFPFLEKNALNIMSFFRLYFLFSFVALFDLFAFFFCSNIFLLYYIIFFDSFATFFLRYYFLILDGFELISFESNCKNFNLFEKIFVYLLYGGNGLMSRKIVRQILTKSTR